jgi:general secretion pathway protein E
MMVIKILDLSHGLISLEDLGLESVPLLTWRQLLALPYGMVLVSGPTGAGKTTTLYASVVELIKDRGNIMTVEDPIEYRVEGLNQIQVNRAAGIDFPAGLQAIMGLSPDIVMVGEIRDAETARIAVNAALTGHLVLASIHSNDAAAAVVRLVDLGVERFMVATAVVGSLAQRLVRKVCPRCQSLAKPSPTEDMAYALEMKESLGQVMVGQGCNFCGGTGFSGRTGVFELMVLDDSSIQKLVAAGASRQEIQAQALANGMVPLRRAGMIKAKGGQTTLGEVFKNVFVSE